MKSEMKPQKGHEHKKTMSEKKIRIIAFAITGALCAAIVVVGLNYVNRLRSRSNAELTVTASAETIGMEEETLEASETTEVPETTEAPENNFPIAAIISETQLYTESSDENRIPAEETNASENQGFEITAYADSTGCYLSWIYGDDYQNCVLQIELTDGTTDYKTVTTIGIERKEYIALSERHAGTVGARIVINDITNNGLVEREVRTIVVENRNIVAVDAADIIGAESGYDISSLFA